MSYWATRRKLSFLSVFFVLLFLGVALPTFFLLEEAPTCFDGRQNGEEEGVDCGGICTLLCKSNTLSPLIRWQRAFKVTPGLYNAVAYVENPNVESSAENVPYRFELYGSDGKLLGSREGNTRIPSARIFPIFEDRISTGGEAVSRATFEFTAEPVWNKDTSKPPSVRVANQYLESGSSPRVFATIENNSINELYRLPVVALVYDSNQNAIAGSRTYIDALPKSGKATVAFTWPEELKLGEGACEMPSDIVLAVDRSGSMDDDGGTPPEPFSSVKKAAEGFIKAMKEGDRAGLVSFGTRASDPPDSTLTADFEGLMATVRNLEIKTGGEQNTNIGDAIRKSQLELLSERHTPGQKQVIVLLTDGEPTDPRNESNPEYPEEFALLAADEARAAGIEIYSIGLGSKTNEELLRKIAGSEKTYFNAATTLELPTIYSKIAASICKLGPAKIEIIPLLP